MTAQTVAGPTSRVVIPARLASTRLPRKLLLRETGQSLLEHTYRAAHRARLPSGVCVAADHAEIADEVRRFGGEVRMTSPDAASGTDRIAELARDASFAGVEIVVNVQGDEPELSGDAIDLVIDLLSRHPEAVMATLATPIRSREQLTDPSCVKVVFDRSLSDRSVASGATAGSPSSENDQATGKSTQVLGGNALYFSRSQIPFAREWSDDLLTASPPNFFQHVGLYAYRREFLVELARLPRSPLERLENLEQLRVLENGRRILVAVVDEPTVGIDTPADYAAFVQRWKSAN